MSLAAIAAGADGLIIEVHDNPEAAWSDGAQSLKPEKFRAVVEKGRKNRPGHWAGYVNTESPLSSSTANKGWFSAASLSALNRPLFCFAKPGPQTLPPAGGNAARLPGRPAPARGPAPA